jgi:hypothetical protein
MSGGHRAATKTVGILSGAQRAAVEVSGDAFSDTFQPPGERGTGFPIAKVPLGDVKMPRTY